MHIDYYSKNGNWLLLMCCVNCSWETVRAFCTELPRRLGSLHGGTWPQVACDTRRPSRHHPLVAVHLAPLLWTTSKLTDHCYSGGRLGPSWQLSILGKNLIYYFLRLLSCFNHYSVWICTLIIAVNSSCEDWSTAGVVTILLRLKLFIFPWHCV